MAHWYDKYLKKDKKKNHSSFWADEFDFDYDKETYKNVLSESQLDTMKKYRLSSGRKAISNFVTIATGQSIPVTFASGPNSYTDGKKVVISGDIDEAEKFDIGVGLALHEGSHILLSDFNLLQELDSHIPKEVKEKAKSKGVSHLQIKDILNVVEDRRIDNFIYKSAPGYREYYLKLYDKYFGDKVITEALKSDEWKEETFENYMNRLINITNPASDVTTLKGFRKIWNILDINNIGRLKSSKDALEVALQIFDVILDSIPAKPFDKNDPQAQQQQQGGGDGEGEEQENGDSDSTEEQDGDGDSSQQGGKTPMMGEDSDDDSAGGASQAGDGKGKEKKSNGLSDAKKKKLNRIKQDQRNFLNGQTKKKKLNNKQLTEIEAVESQGAELVHVGEGMKDRYGNPIKGVDAVVIKELTKKMMMDKSIPLAQLKYKSEALNEAISETEVATAEKMGLIMGKKLQVRNESRSTIYTHQRSGKIDRRLIHSLGFNCETVFNQLQVDKYKKANIHLSIDASGSMNGSKWKKTLINTLALCKAVSMIQNLSIQVSVRYTDDSLPCTVIAFDSRKDSYQKAKSIIPYLHCAGTTPEGLCFEAISKLLVPATNDMDSYFVNISDGEPCFNNNKIEYVGQPAFDHTRKEVEKMRQNGIGVLSYFVAERKLPSFAPFDRMYGKDARYIDINSVGEVSQTLNRMFLTK